MTSAAGTGIVVLTIARRRWLSLAMMSQPQLRIDGKWEAARWGTQHIRLPAGPHILRVSVDVSASAWHNAGESEIPIAVDAGREIRVRYEFHGVGRPGRVTIDGSDLPIARVVER